VNHDQAATTLVSQQETQFTQTDREIMTAPCNSSQLNE
jgi:hypothetical protein